MKMNISGTVIRVEDKVSKKGNSYVVIELIQDDYRYEYFNSMLDSEVTFDRENIIGKNVDLTLNYSPRYRSFKVTDIVVSDD